MKEFNSKYEFDEYEVTFYEIKTGGTIEGELIYTWERGSDEYKVELSGDYVDKHGEKVTVKAGVQ